MPSVFLTSDTHFGHANVCKFMRSDGVTKLRPWDNSDEMDEAMVKLWNAKVKPNDKVYHLGDVVINRRSLHIMTRLNGEKVLIKGNHDIFKLHDYVQHFNDIKAYHVMNGMILSHIPIHEQHLRRFGTNIHGHTHSNRVIKDGIIDVRYHCVCVEQTDFAPILYEDVLARIEAEGGTIGFKTFEEGND